MLKNLFVAAGALLLANNATAQDVHSLPYSAIGNFSDHATAVRSDAQIRPYVATITLSFEEKAEAWLGITNAVYASPLIRAAAYNFAHEDDDEESGGDTCVCLFYCCVGKSDILQLGHTERFEVMEHLPDDFVPSPYIPLPEDDFASFFYQSPDANIQYFYEKHPVPPIGSLWHGFQSGDLTGAFTNRPSVQEKALRYVNVSSQKPFTRDGITHLEDSLLGNVSPINLAIQSYGTAFDRKPRKPMTPPVDNFNSGGFSSGAVAQAKAHGPIVLPGVRPLNYRKDESFSGCPTKNADALIHCLIKRAKKPSS